MTLKEKYPRLFRLEKNKDVSVRNRGTFCGECWEWVWDWAVPPRGRVRGELEDLTSNLESISICADRSDKWTWLLDKDECFSVKVLRKLLVEGSVAHLSSNVSYAPIWNSLIPKKVCIFVWRAIQDRLPVRVKLDDRGIDLNSTLCPWCNCIQEELNHTLINCKEVQPIWIGIFQWWRWNSLGSCSTRELLFHPGHAIFSNNIRRVWQAVLWSAAYIIWKYRNQKVFEQSSTNYRCLISNIQVTSFNWISHRSKRGVLDWNLWLTDPMEAAKNISVV